jgi:hypothetical protein
MTRTRNRIAGLLLVTTCAAILGLALSSTIFASEPGLQDPTGDAPTSKPVALTQPAGTAGAGLQVSAFTAADGLCFRVSEPDGSGGFSIACVNPDEPPYKGGDAVQSVLVQTRKDSTVVIGLAPKDTATVEISGSSRAATVSTTALDAALPTSERLVFFAAKLPGGTDVSHISAMSASGAELSSETLR